jgi:hypothetical protein
MLAILPGVADSPARDSVACDAGDPGDPGDKDVTPHRRG